MSGEADALNADILLPTFITIRFVSPDLSSLELKAV